MKTRLLERVRKSKDETYDARLGRDTPCAPTQFVQIKPLDFQAEPKETITVCSGYESLKREIFRFGKAALRNSGRSNSRSSAMVVRSEL